MNKNQTALMDFRATVRKIISEQMQFITDDATMFDMDPLLRTHITVRDIIEKLAHEFDKNERYMVNLLLLEFFVDAYKQQMGIELSTQTKEGKIKEELYKIYLKKLKEEEISN